MNYYLLTASILITFVGILHSVLGEKRLFSKLRSGNVVPTQAPSPLQERHIRILWATWHVVSLFGFGYAALLYWFALPSTNIVFDIGLRLIFSIPVLVSALLVMWATKGKHPGWVGLLLVGVLISVS